MIFNLIISLCLTIIIELIISLLIGIRNQEDIKVVIWANILTNPVVVYLAICIKLLNDDLIYNSMVIIMEIIVVIVECSIYKKYFEFKEKSPIVISSINNIISFSLGIIISKFVF